MPASKAPSGFAVPHQINHRKAFVHQARSASREHSFASFGRASRDLSESFLLFRAFHVFRLRKIPHRQPDLKPRFARPGLEFDFAAMTVADNAVTDHQAKASACPDRF